MRNISILSSVQFTGRALFFYFMVKIQATVVSGNIIAFITENSGLNFSFGGSQKLALQVGRGDKIREIQLSAFCFKDC